jgi:hypothetical protein
MTCAFCSPGSFVTILQYFPISLSKLFPFMLSFKDDDCRSVYNHKTLFLSIVIKVIVS